MTYRKKYFCNKCKKTHYSSGKIYYEHLNSSNSHQKKPSCKKCKKNIEIAADGLCYSCYDKRYWKRGELKKNKKR